MSKPDAWMPLFIGDYHADTARLTTEQHGAYLLLIMDYWRNGPPPDDNAVLAQIAKLEKRGWLKHRAVLARMFQVDGGEWRHKRIDAELSGATARAKAASEKAARAAAARWGKDSSGDASSDAPSIPQGQLEQCPLPSPSPLPSEVEEPEASLLVAESDVTAKSKSKAKGYPEAFEDAWKVYPHVKGRSSKPKSLIFWRKLTAADRTALPQAVQRYAREGREPKMDCGAPAMDRWLRDEKHADWLAKGPTAVVVAFDPAEQARRIAIIESMTA